MSPLKEWTLLLSPTMYHAHAWLSKPRAVSWESLALTSHDGNLLLSDDTTQTGFILLR
jgi:hypothetical protein